MESFTEVIITSGMVLVYSELRSSRDTSKPSLGLSITMSRMMRSGRLARDLLQALPAAERDAHGVAVLLQQDAVHLHEIRVVIHQAALFMPRSWVSSLALSPTGMRTRKDVPFPTSLSTVMSPACIFTTP